MNHMVNFIAREYNSKSSIEKRNSEFGIRFLLFHLCRADSIRFVLLCLNEILTAISIKYFVHVNKIKNIIPNFYALLLFLFKNIILNFYQNKFVLKAFFINVRIRNFSG